MTRILSIGALVMAVTASTVCAQEPGGEHDGARAALITLAASSASLQAYDTYSTLAGLSRGAVETNPLMRSVARRPAAFVALKAGIAASSIVAGARLWKQDHHSAAVVLLAITSGTMAAVALHNASVLRRMRAPAR